MSMLKVYAIAIAAQSRVARFIKRVDSPDFVPHFALCIELRFALFCNLRFALCTLHQATGLRKINAVQLEAAATPAAPHKILNSRYLYLANPFGWARISLVLSKVGYQCDINKIKNQGQ